MGIPAPKPHNFDRLSEAWSDREAFAREVGVYLAQIRTERAQEAVDITEPRR